MRAHQEIRQAKSALLRPTVGAVSLASIALILSACVVGPKYEQPAVPVNTDWSIKAETQGVSKTEPAAEWWKEFNDPALDQLIEMAYHQNLSLQLAALRIMESRAQLGIAIGRQYPQIQALSASATATRITDRAAQNLNVDPTFWDNQVSFDAAWEPDFWG